MEPYQAAWTYQPLAPGYRPPSRWPSTRSCVQLGGTTSLLGLVLWGVGLLRARGTTEEVFAKVGFTPAALKDLHTQVSLGVGLLVPLVLLVLLGIIWLEGLPPDTPGRPPLPPAHHVSALAASTLALWVLLFAAAGAVTASGAWLVGMQVLESYTPGGGGWGPWWPPVDLTAGPAPVQGVGGTGAAGVAPPVAPGDVPRLLRVNSKQQQQLAAAAGGGGADSAAWHCPSGCVDLGWWGRLPASGSPPGQLGGPCICTPQLLKDMEQKIEQVEGLLVMSLLGALLLLGSCGALHGALAAAWARASDCEAAGGVVGGGAPAAAGLGGPAGGD